MSQYFNTASEQNVTWSRDVCHMVQRCMSHGLEMYVTWSRDVCHMVQRCKGKTKMHAGLFCTECCVSLTVCATLISVQALRHPKLLPTKKTKCIGRPENESSLAAFQHMIQHTHTRTHARTHVHTHTRTNARTHKCTHAHTVFPFSPFVIFLAFCLTLSFGQRQPLLAGLYSEYFVRQNYFVTLNTESRQEW